MNTIHPIVPRTRAVTVACAIWVASATALAPEASDEELEDTSIDALKIAYMLCDRRSINGALSSADIMHCSVLYEELKQRAFGGNFEKLLAWSRANRSTPTIAR